MSTARPFFQPEPPREPAPKKPSIHLPRYRSMRVLAWVASTGAALLILVAIATTILVNSRRFHDYVLSKAESIAGESLGTRVQIQNYVLHFSTLSLDVYGVTVHGSPPYSDPPLLRLQQAKVGLGIVSVLKRKWYLSQLQLVHPVVQIFVDKNGISNLPKPKSSNTKSNTTVFDLGIRYITLERGEIYYNAQKIALSAELRDADFRASFNEFLTMYSGSLAYTNGRVVFGTYRAFEHSVDAAFDYTPTAFHLRHATLASGDCKVNLVATATNLNAPVVQGTYQIVLDGNQLAKLTNNPSIPGGFVNASGSVHYRDVPNQPAIENLAVDGDVTSPHLVVRRSLMQMGVDQFAAHYSFVHGDATLRDLSARLLGGEMTAQGTMKKIGGSSRSNVTASLRNLSLASAIRMSRTDKNLPLSLSGVVNVAAKASWGKTIGDLVAQVDTSIHGAAAGTHSASTFEVNASNAQPQAPDSVPVESEIHATYTGGNRTLSLNQSYLHTLQSRLTVNGTVGIRSSLTVQLHADDLREVATIAEFFRAPRSGQPQTPLDLAGKALFQGTVEGTTSAPHIVGQLSCTGLRVNGTGWRVFRASIDANPSRASLREADLEPDPSGHITFNAATDLQNWRFTNASPIQVDLDAAQLRAEDLLKLAGQQIPVSGTLNAHVKLYGTALNPIGTGTLVLANASAYKEPVTSVQASFHGTGDDAQANLSVQLPAGKVQGSVDIRPKQKAYFAQLTSSGIDISKLESIKAQDLGATGIVAIRVNGQGTFENPEFNASVQVPSLAIREQVINNVNLNLDLVDQVANATLTSSALATSISAKARVRLGDEYQAEASIDTQGIQLQPLVAIYSPEDSASLTGQTELHATLRGPLKNKNAIEAHLTIPYLKAAYNKTIEIASAEPIHADYVNGVLRLQHGAIRGTDTNLEFEGSVPVVDHQAPMSLLLRGDIDLQLAQLFDPDVRTSGQLRFNINSRGVTGGDIDGEIDVVDANYASTGLPVGLQHGNGVLTLSTNRVNIKSFEGTVGGGKITAQGGVAYRPAVAFDLGLTAKGIRMLYPEGLRESVDANIRLTGSTENTVLGGSVNLTNLSFTPAFDLGNFLSKFSSGVAAPPSLGFSQKLNLNLAVQSTNNVNLVSRTLSVNGSANLRVRGTAADPVILGRVDLTGGDIILNDDRFVLNSGTIQFVNPAQTQPVVNVNIATTISQYNINMRINGPIDQMRTQYTSDPALPEADIIRLLAFGQTTEAATNAPSATANQQAESLVASAVSSQISSRISKAAGISQLSISPVLGNTTNQGAGANITIQQRVTGNLFITFSTNTANAQSEVIQGQYQISPRVAFSATRDPNGGFGFDTLIKKNW